MRRFDLRFKLWIALLAFTVIASLFFGAIAIYRLNFELNEQFINRGESLAEHIAQEAVDVVQRGSREGVRHMLTGILSSDIVYVQVVYRGEIVAEEHATDLALAVERPPSSLALRRTRLSDNRPVLDLINPWALEKDAPPQGYVRLGLVLTYLSEEMWLEAGIIGAVSLGVLLVGTVLTIWMHRRLVRPIGALSHSVRAFGDGALRTRAQVHTRDELQDLAEDFNKMADSIVKMQEELEQASKAKSQFFTVMGHELRTPLNSLLGYAELLLEEVDGRLTELQKERLLAAQRVGHHMSELIENMLRFSKLEMGAESLRLQEVDCKVIAEEALQGVVAIAREKKLALRFARRTPLKWVADPMKLRQILLNLLDNALKYGERGPIEVSVRRLGEEVLFSVKDHGPGIAEADQKKIFEPFTQLGNSTTRAARGIGLGLAIVKQYVGMHQGRIWVESTLGEGSAFSFTIPRLALPKTRGKA